MADPIETFLAHTDLVERLSGPVIINSRALADQLMHAAGQLADERFLRQVAAAIKTERQRSTGNSTVTDAARDVDATNKVLGDNYFNLLDHVVDLTRDAERYRTLRHSLSGQARCSHTRMPRVGTPWNYQITYTPEGLDKVLDEIIEGRQQPTNCKFAAGGASCGDPRCMS